MDIHLLRPESVTPIVTYLARSDAAPTRFAPQLDLAIALLYREREYAVMYWATLDPPPIPATGSPFQPYAVTPAGAAFRAWSLGQGPTFDPQRDLTDSYDLFGLKSDVVARLTATLRPVAAQRFGWAVAAQLCLDLCRHGEAVAAAERAADLGVARFGLPLAHQAALVGAHEATLGAPVPRGLADGEHQARRIRARARREGVSTNDRILRREWDDWLRRAGVRVRGHVEGEAFTRFVTTEARYCESERAAALAAFDITRVPPGAPRARGPGADDRRGRRPVSRPLPS